MRIVVVSDTHGDISDFERVVMQQPRADVFIHLGDCERDVDDIRLIFPQKPFISVSGNCDFGSQVPSEGETVIAGKRIFYTHGHKQFVKAGTSILVKEARRRQADIVLYGHTHVPENTYEDGLYILNPGSVGHPSVGGPTYGVVDITPAGIVLNIAEV